jgi:hypothetical protein
VGPVHYSAAVVSHGQPSVLFGIGRTDGDAAIN